MLWLLHLYRKTRLERLACSSPQHLGRRIGAKHACRQHELEGEKLLDPLFGIGVEKRTLQLWTSAINWSTCHCGARGHRGDAWRRVLAQRAPTPAVSIGRGSPLPSCLVIDGAATGIRAVTESDHQNLSKS